MKWTFVWVRLYLTDVGNSILYIILLCIPRNTIVAAQFSILMRHPCTSVFMFRFLHPLCPYWPSQNSSPTHYYTFHHLLFIIRVPLLFHHLIFVFRTFIIDLAVFLAFFFFVDIIPSSGYLPPIINIVLPSQLLSFILTVITLILPPFVLPLLSSHDCIHKIW